MVPLRIAPLGKSYSRAAEDSCAVVIRRFHENGYKIQASHNRLADRRPNPLIRRGDGRCRGCQRLPKGVSGRGHLSQGQQIQRPDLRDAGRGGSNRPQRTAMMKCQRHVEDVM